MMFGTKARFCLAASLIALSAPSIANAQAESVAAEASTGQDQDIVVTATRREQKLQDVPIAVNALSGDDMASNRISQTSDLSQLVPNLQITSQVGAFVVYLRGVGQLATNAGQEPSVATYVDGVYQPTVYGSLLSLSNVERVEVIKGPQGTLFGRNATGGLISVTTKDPSHDPAADLLLSYGNYNTFKTAGYMTAGVTDTLAADFTFYYKDQDKGVGRNVLSGKEIYGQRNVDFRGKLLFEPTDATKIKIGASYTENRSANGNNLALLPGSVGADGTTALPGFYDIYGNIEPFNKNQTWAVNGRIDQEFNLFNLVAISAYSVTKDIEFEDGDGLPTNLLIAVLSQKVKAFTQEVQLVSKKGSPLTWIVGGFYYNSDGRGEPTGTGVYGLAFGGGGLQSKPVLKATSIAIYGEATYEVLPKLNLTIGGRYTVDKKRLSGVTEVVDGNKAVVASIPIGPTSKRYKQPTYRAIADYHFTKDVMGYLSYSRGFKSGGYDTGFANGIAFEPETIDAFEGGVKAELFEKRLRFNAAAFLYDYKNLQLPILIKGANGAISQVTLNAATAKVTGLDIDGSLKVASGLSLKFGLGYLDSKYKKFLNAPCTARNAAGATTQSACDVSGNQTINAPKLTFNIGGNFTVPTNMGDFELSGSYSHKSSIYFDVTDRLSQSPYGLVNGQLSWTAPGGRYKVIAYAENLLNKKYTTVQYAQPALGDSYVAGKPCMYGIELRAKF